MRDVLGVEVEIGDVIVSASGQGRHKVGKVYGFSGNGLSLIEVEERAYDVGLAGYAKKWRKVSSGWSVLVIGREKLGQMQPTDEVWNAITREYPGDAPNLG